MARQALGNGIGERKRGLDSIISPTAKSRNKGKTGQTQDLSAGAASRGRTRAKTKENAENQEPTPTPKTGTKARKAAGKTTAQAKGKAAEPAAQGGEVQLPILDIEPNREQPRKVFDEDALQELAESIRQYGVLSPILVQKNGDYYEIIAGERRWRAAKMAGLKKVPVIIREYTRQEVVEISLIENIQREDLNPIEEARAYKRLLTEFDLTQEVVAARVSKSRAAITNSTRLLKLDARVQDMLIDGSLTAGHARALLSVSDPDTQSAMAKRIADERLSVREVERLVKGTAKRTSHKKTADPFGFLYRDMENRLAEALGTKTAIRRGSGKKGKIEISYHSDEELERLTAQICSANG